MIGVFSKTYYQSQRNDLAVNSTTVLSENLGSVPSTHINTCVTPSSVLPRHLIHVVHRHTRRQNTYTHKIMKYKTVREDDSWPCQGNGEGPRQREQEMQKPEGINELCWIHEQKKCLVPGFPRIWFLKLGNFPRWIEPIVSNGNLPCAHQ